MSTEEILVQKRDQYRAYIEEHKQNIEYAWGILKRKINKGQFWLDVEMMKKIETLVHKHDESKYSEEEFEGYRQWFYPAGDDHINQDLFDAAYLHHQNCCPHHYLHWILRHDGGMTPVDMPLEYIIEMLLDFEAMGMKFNDGAYQYWQSHKNNMLMAENTKKLVDHWILLFKRTSDLDTVF